jgi:hypothetical protein
MKINSVAARAAIGLASAVLTTMPIVPAAHAEPQYIEQATVTYGYTLANNMSTCSLGPSEPCTSVTAATSIPGGPPGTQYCVTGFGNASTGEDHLGSGGVCITTRWCGRRPDRDQPPPPPAVSNPAGAATAVVRDLESRRSMYSASLPSP